MKGVGPQNKKLNKSYACVLFPIFIIIISNQISYNKKYIILGRERIDPPSYPYKTAKQCLSIYFLLASLHHIFIYNFSIQSQYVFIHDALRELVICGDTEITAANIRIIINQLNRPIEDGNTGFQKQFQVLVHIQKERERERVRLRMRVRGRGREGGWEGEREKGMEREVNGKGIKYEIKGN